MNDVVLMCNSCGVRPRAAGARMTWCQPCKTQWQREYRKGLRRQERVPAAVRDENGCLIWQGAVNAETGYGQGTRDGRCGYPHRWAFMDAHGPLDDGMTVDHLCEVKLCIEPTHLEACTRSENTRRYYERRAA